MSRQIPDGVLLFPAIDFELKLFRWPDHSPKGVAWKLFLKLRAAPVP